MDTTALRAGWSHRQGLDGSLAGSGPAGVLERAGWARSVGGANPYLTLWSRAGITREAADAAVADLSIYELPSARGCTYVLPAAHYGLGLQVGRGAAEGELRTLAKLGVDRAEVERVCAGVLEVLAGEPLDPARLKDALGGLIRDLGPEGRKRGAATTLPAALGLLQSAGEIRRVPVNGRLDQQRYGYVRWQPPTTGLTDEEARVELARLYFAWAGPATLAHFRWFSAFSATHAKAAVAALDLVDLGDGYLAGGPVDDEPPAEPDYRLVASIDGLFLLRRDLPPLLDPADAGRLPVAERNLLDLEHHAIVDRGRIVGLWEYDVADGRIVWASFDPPNDALRAAVAVTEGYVRDQLGDARSFSLDSPKARVPRIAALGRVGE